MPNSTTIATRPCLLFDVLAQPIMSTMNNPDQMVLLTMLTMRKFKGVSFRRVRKMISRMVKTMQSAERPIQMGA